MLNDQDALFREQRLGVIVYQLPVDETIDAVGCDRFNFCFHLFSFGAFELGKFTRGVYLYTGAKDFDLVGIHG